MNEQAIVERIISDAEEEARAIIKEAEARFAQTVAAANGRAERNRRGTEAEVRAKAVAVSDGKAASARLDGAKILLGEKRGVIEEVYARALKKLVGLGEKETLYLSARLLGDYAEEGDEIVFAENCPFAQNVAALPVGKEKSLKFRRGGQSSTAALCCAEKSPTRTYPTARYSPPTKRSVRPR